MARRGALSVLVIILALCDLGCDTTSSKQPPNRQILRDAKGYLLDAAKAAPGIENLIQKIEIDAVVVDEFNSNSAAAQVSFALQSFSGTLFLTYEKGPGGWKLLRVQDRGMKL